MSRNICIRNQGLLAFYISLHVFAEGIRTVAVHGHLADQCAHASLLIQVHQLAGALGMYGAEDDAAHGAEQPLGMQEAAIHALGIVDVGILRLLGESVVL